MADGGFRAGQNLIWCAANYVIERLISGDRWQLRNLRTNEYTAHELCELLRAYEVGDLIFQCRGTVESDPDAELERLLARSLSSFPEADVSSAKRLERYCVAIDAQKFQSLDPNALRPFIAEKMKEFSDPHPPNATKLYRAYRSWIRSAGQVWLVAVCG